MKKYFLLVIFMAPFLLTGCLTKKAEPTEQVITPKQPVQELPVQNAKDKTADKGAEVIVLEPGDEKPQCHIQSCHFEEYEPKCSLTEPLVCTLDIKPSDFCGQFASCDKNCNINLEPEYKECLDCFLECNNQDVCNISDECKDKFPAFEEKYSRLTEGTQKIEDDLVQKALPKDGEKKCYVQSCHYEEKDVTCGYEPAGPCTLDIKPTDYCRRFVKCDPQCELLKISEYEDCVDCFIGCNSGDCQISKECLLQFPGFKDEFPNIKNKN